MDLDNFIIDKTKDRRGEGRVGKKSNSCLTNIEQQLMAKVVKMLLNRHRVVARKPFASDFKSHYSSHEREREEGCRKISDCILSWPRTTRSSPKLKKGQLIAE